MEAAVKAISIRASKLYQEGIGVTILTYCFLHLTESILGITNFLLLVFKDLP